MGSDGIERAASSRTLPVGDNALPESPVERLLRTKDSLWWFSVALFSNADSKAWQTQLGIQKKVQFADEGRSTSNRLQVQVAKSMLDSLLFGVLG